MTETQHTDPKVFDLIDEILGQPSSSDMPFQSSSLLMIDDEFEQVSPPVQTKDNADDSVPSATKTSNSDEQPQISSSTKPSDVEIDIENEDKDEEDEEDDDEDDEEDDKDDDVRRMIDEEEEEDRELLEDDLEVIDNGSSLCQTLNITYKRITIQDTSDARLIDHFEEGCDFLADCLFNKRQNVLVHCREGLSRSPSMVIAFLMRHLGWSLERAFKHVHAHNLNKLRINEGFKRQLMEFEMRLFGTNSKDFFDGRRRSDRRPTDPSSSSSSSSSC